MGNANSRESRVWHLVDRNDAEALAEFLAFANVTPEQKRRMVEWEDIVGRTPLFHAADRGYYDCAALLLQHGARVKFNNYCTGWLSGTPLHAATRMGNEDVVELLLKNRASPFVANKRGLTSLDEAHRFSRKNLIERFAHLAPFKGTVALEWKRYRGIKTAFKPKHVIIFPVLFTAHHPGGPPMQPILKHRLWIFRDKDMSKAEAKLSLDGVLVETINNFEFVLRLPLNHPRSSTRVVTTVDEHVCLRFRIADDTPASIVTLDQLKAYITAQAEFTYADYSAQTAADRHQEDARAPAPCWMRHVDGYLEVPETADVPPGVIPAAPPAAEAMAGTPLGAYHQWAEAAWAAAAAAPARPSTRVPSSARRQGTASTSQSARARRSAGAAPASSGVAAGAAGAEVGPGSPRQRAEPTVSLESWGTGSTIEHTPASTQPNTPATGDQAGATFAAGFEFGRVLAAFSGNSHIAHLTSSPGRASPEPATEGPLTRNISRRQSPAPERTAAVAAVESSAVSGTSSSDDLHCVAQQVRRAQTPDNNKHSRLAAQPGPASSPRT